MSSELRFPGWQLLPTIATCCSFKMTNRYLEGARKQCGASVFTRWYAFDSYLPFPSHPDETEDLLDTVLHTFVSRCIRAAMRLCAQ